MNKTPRQSWLRIRMRPFGRRNARGVAAAELAVCLPIVVLLVIATIEACSAVFLKQSLTVAAYEGVRTALEEGATARSVQRHCNRVLSDRTRERRLGSAVDPSNIDGAEARRLRRRDGLCTRLTQTPSCPPTFIAAARCRRRHR